MIQDRKKTIPHIPSVLLTDAQHFQPVFKPIPGAFRRISLQQGIHVKQCITIDPFLQIVSKRKRDHSSQADGAGSVLYDVKDQSAPVHQLREQEKIKVFICLISVRIFPVEKMNLLLAGKNQ